MRFRRRLSTFGSFFRINDENWFFLPAKAATMAAMLHQHITHTSLDFTETRDFLAQKGLETRLADKHALRAEKDFRSRISAVYGRGLYIAYMEYGANIEIDAPAERGDYGFSIPYGGTMAASSGADMLACTRKQTVLASPGKPQTMFLSGDSRRLALSLQQDRVRERLTTLTGEPVRGRIEFDPVLDVASGAGRMITSNMELIVAEQDRGTDVFADGLREAHFEETVLSTLLLYHHHSHRRMRERPMGAPASRDVKRVIDFLHVALEQPVMLEDLVEIAGVPARTLNEHFRAYTGRSPMAYLRELRLNAARRLLMSGEAETVTLAAMRYGFLHLGRFSVSYRQSFGETPSHTLARAMKVNGRA